MQEGSANYFKSLRILHTALLAGQCILLAVMLLLVMLHKNPSVDASFDKILQVTALVLSFGSAFISGNIFKNRLLDINANATDTAEKAGQYRAANIVRWAMVEGPALFTIICFFLTGNYSFAALAIAMIVFFALTGPSRLKAMIHLQLSEQQVDELQ